MTDGSEGPGCTTTALEEVRGRVVELWSGMLGVPIADIADDSDFFTLGGDSFRAVRLISKLNNEYGIDIELIDLFEWPDVEGFTALVQARIREAVQAAPATGILRVDRAGPLLASSVQRRIWFLEELSRDETDAYSVGMVLWLRGTLHEDALRSAFSTIVERHESLRTVVYMNDEGEVLQRIEPATAVPMPVIALPESDVDDFKAGFMGQRLDIAATPLIKVTLLDLGEQRYVLLIRVHDIAYDAWSGSVLMYELGMLYGAHCRDEPNPLPLLGVQYADYAQWKARKVDAEELARQLSYWQTQLAGCPDALTLSTDRPRSGVERSRGACLFRILPAALLNDLLVLGRMEGATLFVTLTAAFNVLLWWRSGQSDIPIGTVTFDRVAPGLEQLIGAFLNTIVLRTKLVPTASFREFLRQVDATARAAYGNQDIPFEHVVQGLRQNRDHAHASLFRVMMAMQNTPQEPLQLWNLELEKMEWISPGARCDLLLRTAELPEGLGVWMEYDSDLFDPRTIDNLIDLFQGVLEHCSQGPDQPLTQLRGSSIDRAVTEV